MKFYIVAVEDTHGCFYHGPEPVAANSLAEAIEEAAQYWKNGELLPGHRVVLYECNEIKVLREGLEEK